ncbi:helix-turn-helix domain-containing protein [Streptomyces sp. NPDC058818]|uniref:helix-turn-helix domain-containing protein n=1 Tax=Streptomyces sp. NPDC058818 TaxID=3346640 RepID=UPI0036A4CC57
MSDESDNGETTLASLRARVGMTQAQVAEKMFVSPAQVSRIEALYPHLMFPTLRAYLDALGVDIKFALEGRGEWLSGDVIADINRSDVLRLRRLDPTRRGFRRRTLDHD